MVVIFYDFPYIGNVIIPTDEFIFFRGVGIPPTRWGHMEKNPWFSVQPRSLKPIHNEAGAAVEVIDDAGSSPLRLER